VHSALNHWPAADTPAAANPSRHRRLIKSTLTPHLRRYLQSLRKIGAVLISSAGSFAAIGALLMLFWVVFSIVGLHVYGGTPLDEPWPNFDTLINSMLTMFNVLNLENFQVGRAVVALARVLACSA
jgi:hypothetical protein